MSIVSRTLFHAIDVSCGPWTLFPKGMGSCALWLLVLYLVFGMSVCAYVISRGRRVIVQIQSTNSLGTAKGQDISDY